MSGYKINSLLGLRNDIEKALLADGQSAQQASQQATSKANWLAQQASGSEHDIHAGHSVFRVRIK